MDVIEAMHRQDKEHILFSTTVKYNEDMYILTIFTSAEKRKEEKDEEEEQQQQAKKKK